MERKRHRYYLVAIISFAFLFRLLLIIKSPLSLYWEEAALGYDAYSILKTGHDYHGNPFPVVAFPSFGDYKPSLYFYTAVPSIAAFGLNEFAIRLPSAMAGIIGVILLYLICRQLKLNQTICLLAPWLLSISPWHLQFSQAAFEVNLGTTLFFAGVLLILKSLNRPKLLFPAAIFMVLSMYAYHGFRLLAPLAAISLVLTHLKKLKFKSVIAPTILSIMLLLPLIANLNSPLIKQRFLETSHFSTSPAVVITNHYRQLYDNSWWSRIIFHRYWWWGGEVLNNYLAHFNFNFLFINGDQNIRHGTQEFGLLYHWEFITIIYGIYVVIKKRNHRLTPLLLIGLLTPIPAAITQAAPHALRTLPLSYIYAVISAYGLFHLIKVTKPRIIKAIIPLLIAGQFLLFLHFYFAHYPNTAASEWQYGYRQAITFTESVKDQYQTIYFTRKYGRPSIYVLFYGNYDPQYIQSIEPSLKKDQLELLELGHYQFTDSPSASSGNLIVAHPNDIPAGIIPIDIINFPDGSPAFVIYET